MTLSNVKMSQCASIEVIFATALRTVRMGVMKILSLAKTIQDVATYIHNSSTTVTMVVAFFWKWPVVPRINRCAKTVVIWSSPSVGESVIIIFLTWWIHIGGLAQMAPRNAFSTHLDAMGYMIVMMAAMNVLVRWWYGFVFTTNFCFVYS